MDLVRCLRRVVQDAPSALVQDAQAPGKLQQVCTGDEAGRLLTGLELGVGEEVQGQAGLPGDVQGGGDEIVGRTELAWFLVLWAQGAAW